MRDQIHLCDNAEALARHARDWLVELIQVKSAGGSEPFVLALSGGSTPKRLYHLLSELPAGEVDWRRVVLLWGDERNVASEHADSNYRMVKESLLDRIQIPSENVLAVPNPGGPAEIAAVEYEALIRERLTFGPGTEPVVDCNLLGLGDDVHTASLFPGSAALSEQSRLVLENYVEKLSTWRITFSAPFINAAANVAFLVAGAAKQTALGALWQAPFNPGLYPAQLVRPVTGKLWFLVDQAAVGSTPIPESGHVELINQH